MTTKTRAEQVITSIKAARAMAVDIAAAEDISEYPRLTKMKQAEEYAKYLPLSICTCGHTGDGANSFHVDLLQDGSGSCRMPSCPCRQFTWAKWTERAETLLGLMEVKS